MASISFQTPEKINDENRPLHRTPRTPNSQKNQGLGRTSSQKKARQIFDSLRSLKSRGKPSSDVEDEGDQSAGNGSPIRRKNSTWDLFGTIRSRKSSEFGSPEHERPLTNTPFKSGLQIDEASELLPKRRKSLVNIIGSISNKVSPRRSANLREITLNEGRLPVYCEDDVFAKKLAKELVDLNAEKRNPTHTSSSNEQSRFPNETLRGSYDLEVDHNNIIESFKLRQLDDLLNDRDGNDANSWTSKAQTLQNDETAEQLVIQTPTTDTDRSKTPDSYLCSIIKSFDDYDSGPTVSKGKGAAISPSPSPDKLKPTKPIDFLKDPSPDVIRECRSGPSKQFMNTTSSVNLYPKKPETPEKIYREETRPIITIREVTSDSDFSSVCEDSIAPSPPTWQDAAVSRNAMLESRARLPHSISTRFAQEAGSGLKERKDLCQGLKQVPYKAEDLDQQRIARSIKQTVDKMTKNLHLSSFSEETTEDWDDELSKENTYPCEIEYKYSIGSHPNLDDFSKTVEDHCTETLEKSPVATMIRKNISLFKNLEFLAGPIYVRYPQTEIKWRHVEQFSTGGLALSDIRKQNKGKYSDTITYYPEESCIYVHLWGKLPKPEIDLSVRVKYPETKTRWARTQIYDNGDLAMADMKQEDRGEFSQITYDTSERCFHVQTWNNVNEAPNGVVPVDYSETETRFTPKVRWRQYEGYITDVPNDENSAFVYSSPEQNFCGETQLEVMEPVYRTREPSWRPTLSPLGDRDENEQDLPDFSDIETDFQLVATASRRNSSPGIQTQEGADAVIGDDQFGSNDMSLCVEAGTPHKSDIDFIAELFVRTHSDNPTPLLRGSKQILQYLDSLDAKSPTRKIARAEDDPLSDNRISTKTWAESETFNRKFQLSAQIPQALLDIENELTQINESVWLDESSDYETISSGIAIAKEESRKSSNPSFTQGLNFLDGAEGITCGIPIPNEVSVHRQGVVPETQIASENIIFDFDRDAVHRRERSNAISGEGPPLVVSSENKNIYILPIDNIDLYEENAGCGDPKSPSPSQIDENIAAFSADADLTILVPEPIETSIDEKINTHSYSRDLAEIAVKGEAEQTQSRPGLWVDTCIKSPSSHNSSICTASSVSSESGPDIPSGSATKTEVFPSFDKKDDELKNHPKGKGVEVENIPLRVETVTQQYIDDEGRALLNTRFGSKGAPTLVNIFHARGMMSPSSTRPWLDRCSSSSPSLQQNTTPKRGETHLHSPRIVTPSGKVYSPAVEEQRNSNPIQRVQTPGNSLSEDCDGLDVDLSGDETDISEGFGNELEKMGVKRYCTVDADGASLDGSV